MPDIRIEGVSEELHREFKAWCASHGTTMRERLIQGMEVIVEDRPATGEFRKVVERVAEKNREPSAKYIPPKEDPITDSLEEQIEEAKREYNLRPGDMKLKIALGKLLDKQRHAQ